MCNQERKTAGVSVGCRGGECRAEASAGPCRRWGKREGQMQTEDRAVRRSSAGKTKTCFLLQCSVESSLGQQGGRASGSAERGGGPWTEDRAVRRSSAGKKKENLLASNTVRNRRWGNKVAGTAEVPNAAGRGQCLAGDGANEPAVPDAVLKTGPAVGQPKAQNMRERGPSLVVEGAKKPASTRDPDLGPGQAGKPGPPIYAEIGYPHLIALSPHCILSCSAGLAGGTAVVVGQAGSACLVRACV